MSDWYAVSRTDIEKLPGGSSLFTYYRSMKDVLCTVYPEYPWDLSKFTTKVPYGHWTDTKLLDILNDAEKKLAINKVSFIRKEYFV